MPNIATLCNPVRVHIKRMQYFRKWFRLSHQLPIKQPGHNTVPQFLQSLREVLSSEASPKARRKAEITRLVRELQKRRRLCVIRQHGGHLLTDPLKMAKALFGYWSGVMAGNGSTASNCKAFLQSLDLPRQWRGVAPKLLRALTEEVVLTALERMHATSSPGLDGVSAVVYQRMPSVLVPQMLHMVQTMWSSGVVPEAWSLAIMNCIPKRPGVPEVSALRPICLQNSVFKWFTSTLLLLLEDLISFVTPKEQKAFLRGRSILDHIWGSRGAWDHYTVGAFLTVDFAKAYDSVQHAYMRAVLEYLGVDQALIALLIRLFRAPFFFAVGRGVVREEKVYPHSGVRQGDPLSPALFVLFCSPLIVQLQAVSPLLVVCLYADDLLVHLEAMPRPALRVMKGVIAALERFGDLSGLRLNFDKTRFLLRGFWPDPVRQQMEELGCKADPSTRYLGIRLGAVCSEEAFAPALAKAMARARSVAHFSLDLSECAELLQTWILPIFAFPAKAYFRPCARPCGLCTWRRLDSIAGR